MVPKAWEQAVVDERGRIERIPYELCVLVALREALRRREVYVAGAGRWSNPEDDLPGDFETSRDVHYAAIRAPLDPSEFIAGLQRWMRERLDVLAAANEDRRGLSPLFWSHINPYGRFRLDMDTRLDLAGSPVGGDGR